MRERPNRLIELTDDEARSVLEAGAVALIPCGAINAHGQRLPYGTEVIIAEAVAERAAEHLRTARIASAILPPIALGVEASTTPGALAYPETTLTAVVRDTVLAAKAAGFRAAALCAPRSSEAHTRAMREGCEQARTAGAAVVCPDLTSLSSGVRTHRLETSLVMVARPFLVHVDLPSNDKPPSAPPSPASATEAEGHRACDELARIVTDAVRRLMVTD